MFLTTTKGAALEAYVQLLVYLAGPAVIALITVVVYIWRDFTSYKLYVAENYVKQQVLREMQNDMKEMKNVLYQIAAKVGVSINKPF